MRSTWTEPLRNPSLCRGSRCGEAPVRFPCTSRKQLEGRLPFEHHAPRSTGTVFHCVLVECPNLGRNSRTPGPNLLLDQRCPGEIAAACQRPRKTHSWSRNAEAECRSPDTWRTSRSSPPAELPRPQPDNALQRSSPCLPQRTRKRMKLPPVNPCSSTPSVVPERVTTTDEEWAVSAARVVRSRWNAWLSRKASGPGSGGSRQLRMLQQPIATWRAGVGCGDCKDGVRVSWSCRSCPGEVPRCARDEEKWAC